MRKKVIKDCKRILSATVCAVTAAVFAMAGAKEVSAADAAQLKVSEASGYEGGTVSVTLSLTDNPGIAGAAFKIGYDKEVLSVVSATETENAILTRATVNTEGDGFVGYSYADVANISDSGDFLTIEFAIKEGAPLGDSEITLYGLDFSNDEYEDVEVSAENGKVTVLCSHSDKTVNTTAATCTEAGKTVTICNQCGEIVSEEEIPALGHTWGEVAVETEPTCTEAGKGIKTCTVCGETEEVELPALGHTWGEVVVETEPTCTEAGKGVRTCTICGETEEVELPALGHTWGEVVVEIEPTATEAGKGIRTCTICGETEEVEIPALGQEATEPSSDGNDQTTGKNESADGKVQTGDNAGTTAAVLFLICVVSGMTAIVVYKKRAVR